MNSIKSMNQKLNVSNFLVIKKAVVDVNKINIIIGPQANGKSLLAKLLHYFKSSGTEIVEHIRKDTTKRDLDKSLLKSFETHFPRYTWEGTSFEIGFYFNNSHLEIKGSKNSKGKTILTLGYSENIPKQISTIKKDYIKKRDKARREDQGDESSTSDTRRIFFDSVNKPLRQGELSPLFSSPIFIPASRSFFANLQKNIFTFLASNVDIDPFLTEFGSLYETAKRWYKDMPFYSSEDKRNASIANGLYKSVEAIISGDYESHDEQDWIVSKGRRTNLANASSGQQEALPMLLSLCVWPFLRSNSPHNMCFIEEPEAHLFPTSQGYLVSVFSQIYSQLDSNLFITTHSPYIISSLNNLILGADKIDQSALSVDEFLSLSSGAYPIRYEDVSAYSISDGILISIKNDEYRLIGADLLDEVSEHFESLMNKLLILGGES